jgi:OPA family sugar phosphate sensor protein UhpC-like MFS transporter
MYVPGVTCILIGFYLINRLRDTPQSLGLPPIEKFKDDYPTAKRTIERESLSVREILFKYVLTNKYIWVLAFSYFFVYVIRQAVNDFGALFLMKTKGYEMMAAYGSIFWFEAGGVCGSLTAGWASDRIFKGRRGPVNVLFSLAVIFALLGLYFVPAGLLYLDYLLMFIVGFFIFGPQMLIGMAATELSHKKAAGSASGFTGWVAYLGAATAGYPITKVIESVGWNGFFIVLGVAAAVSVLLLLPLWKIKTNPKGEAEAAEEEAGVSVSRT